MILSNDNTWKNEGRWHRTSHVSVKRNKKSKSFELNTNFNNRKQFKIKFQNAVI